ncbi:MAG TPA: glucans biosynthesis glucosyltransferase MdoH [Pseudorhodoplanes sp.]|nr:glucans biosynthesis glucosyltransferase MdoH [Pseudorhodoplanes sp.]
MSEFTSLPSAPGPSLSIFQRRAVYCALVIITMAALLWMTVKALAPGGFGLFDLLFLLFFAVTLPWTVIGFWNAVIGFSIMRFARDPLGAVNPAAARIRGDEPVTASTALLLCIRNELPDRVIRNLEPMLAGIAASGYADRFHIYVLSDTSDTTVAAAEDRQFDALADNWRGKIPVTYRRRDKNTGFKAGNIRDFCERWGAQHELAVTLDADSFMTPEAMLRLVRIMQANPQLGILQSLVVGLPSTSAFARLFQFGMRLGMRSYTTGATWWQGDCGPYWGHNGVFRIAPFFEHCHLPPLPADAIFGGEVLSHDQIEAVLMRRAGYEVRVMPVEDNSWEENPPTLVEFLRRDLRWCQGNMQYWYFLGLPGLKFVSRYQLVFALLMFLGSPAWIGMLVLGTLGAASANNLSDIVEPTTAIALFLITFVMWFTPKYSTVVDVLTRPDARRAFGGTAWFFLGVFIETLFSILLVPIMWFGHTVFLVGLLFGRRIGWIGQTRDDHSVPLAVAVRNFWPQTLLGVTSLVILAATHPAAIPIASFIAAGLALSIPLAILTSSPQLGDVMARIGLCGLPEERDVPPALRSLVRAGATPQPA